MALPRITRPTFDAVLPSTGKKVTFHPFTGKSQKALLIAKESNSAADSLRAVIDIVSESFEMDASKLPMYDLEYLFLALRSKSINNKVDVRIKDEEDGKLYDALIDLDTVVVDKPANWKPSAIVDVGAGIGIKLKHPSAGDLAELSGADPSIWDFLTASVDSVFENDVVTTSSDVKKEELKDWLMSLPVGIIGQVSDFFSSKPEISIAAEYEKDGKKVSKKLTGLADFFGSA